MSVISVEKDSIIGLRKNQPFALAKKDIKKMKKNKTGATVALVSGAVGIFIVGYVIADTVSKITEGLVPAAPGK